MERFLSLFLSISSLALKFFSSGFQLAPHACRIRRRTALATPTLARIPSLRSVTPADSGQSILGTDGDGSKADWTDDGKGTGCEGTRNAEQRGGELGENMAKKRQKSKKKYVFLVERLLFEKVYLIGIWAKIALFKQGFETS